MFLRIVLNSVGQCVFPYCFLSVPVDTAHILNRTTRCCLRISIYMQNRKKMFYLTTHSTHFIYGYMASAIWYWTSEKNVLFNDALNTFYLRLYGVRHMVKDHSDSEKGNPLPPHRLLLSINSKGSFICTIPQTG